MEFTDIMTLINNGCFPIAAVIGLAFYLNKLHNEDRQDRKQNMKVLQQFANNINENTILLKQILILLQGGKKDE